MTKNETKITKRMRYAQAMADYQAQDNAEMVAFFAHEIELLDKKNAKKGTKATAKTAENEAMKPVILEKLTEPMTATAIMLAIMDEVKTEESLNNQRVTSVLKRMREDDGTVIRFVKKGKTLFAKADYKEEEGE